MDLIEFSHSVYNQVHLFLISAGSFEKNFLKSEDSEQDNRSLETKWYVLQNLIHSKRFTYYLLTIYFLFPIYLAVYFLIFELKSSVSHVISLIMVYLQPSFLKDMCRWYRRQCHSVRNGYYIWRILLPSTTFHLGASHFSSYFPTESCGKFFLYPLLGSCNLICNWVLSICSPW